MIPSFLQFRPWSVALAQQAFPVAPASSEDGLFLFYQCLNLDAVSNFLALDTVLLQLLCKAVPLQ